MKTARQAVTEDYFAKSRAVLDRNDPFAKEALILLAQSYKQDIEPLANAATRTLLAHSMRNA